MITRETARKRDTADPLSRYAPRYRTGGQVHLNGNSLGPALDDVDARVADVLERWSADQVRGWFEGGWLALPRTVGDKIAALVGAAPGQVVVPGESTSTLLFNALVAALRLGISRPGVTTEECTELLVEAGAFPTDHYIAASAARLLDCTVVNVGADRIDAAVRAGGARVAAVLTSPVDFRTGERRGVARTSVACRATGAISVVDLSHATGVLPVDIDRSGVDLAVGCGYKYLGGGPGAPAFLYVAEHRQQAIDLPLTGWHSHADPFAMTSQYRPAEGIDRGRIGTPQLLSLVALDHALDPLVEVGATALHARSAELAATFVDALADRRPDLAARIVSPSEPTRRGAHLALRCEDADAAEESLRQRGVLVDSRGPDLLRVAFSPLCLDHEQVVSAVESVDAVLEAA